MLRVLTKNIEIFNRMSVHFKRYFISRFYFQTFAPIDLKNISCKKNTRKCRFTERYPFSDRNYFVVFIDIHYCKLYRCVFHPEISWSIIIKDKKKSSSFFKFPAVHQTFLVFFLCFGNSGLK